MKTGFSQGSRETFFLGTECQSASASSSSRATHLSSPQVLQGGQAHPGLYQSCGERLKLPGHEQNQNRQDFASSLMSNWEREM